MRSLGTALLTPPPEPNTGAVLGNGLRTPLLYNDRLSPLFVVSTRIPSGEFDILDEIDGKVVIGIEDDYVVGGELRYFDDEQAVIFESPDDQRVATWLHSSGWSDRIEVSAIKAAVQQL